ncbi:MAG: ATP-binding protein [Spirochaetota bacterium]
MKRENIDRKNTKIEMSARVVGPIIRSFEEEYGTDKLVEFMESSGVPVDYFDNEHNWISYDYWCRLLKKLVNYTGDPDIAYRYGLNSIKYGESWGVLKILFTLSPTPSFTYKSLIRLNPRITKVADLQILEFKKNFAVIQSQFMGKYKQDKNNCLNVQGGYSAIPTIYGLPFARVKEVQCAAEGADSCIYEIKWQNRVFNKREFFSVTGGIVLVIIIYYFIEWYVSHLSGLGRIALFLIPITFFIGGHIFDYIETIKDNSDITNDQNGAVMDSLEKNQILNEELQISIDQRTEELDVVNKKLDKALIDLRRSEEELLKAEKMISVAQLAAGIAHEINNPMGAVRNYLQDVLDDMQESDPRRPKLVEAEKATRESKIIITDLMSFSRTYENLYIIEIDINEVIDKIIAAKSEIFSKVNVKFNKDLEQGLPVVMSDSMQINQVFTNIIMNAFEAIRENGDISIRTSSGAEGVHVDIRDNGDIIPENEIVEIFDTSDTTKFGRGRKDLGLAIAGNIVKRFNGNIDVSSSAGYGTVFNVIIPYTIKVS